MKRWAFLLLLLFFMSSLYSESKCVLEIEGMTCQSCAKAIEKSLREVKGVEKVSVDFKKGKGELTLGKESKVEEKDLIAAVKKAGYEVKKITWLK